MSDIVEDSSLEKALSVTTAMMSTRDIDRLFDLIVETITSSFGFEGCDAYILDNEIDEFRLINSKGYSEEETKQFIGTTAPKKKILNDIEESERLGRFTYLYKAKPGQSLNSYYGLMHPERASLPRENEDDWHELDVLYVVFEDQNGNTIGFLEPDSPLDRKLPSKNLIINLEIFASLASIAVANAELVDELNTTIENYKTLSEAMVALQEPVDLKETLRKLADALSKIVPFDEISVYLIDWERDLMIPAFATGPFAENIMADVGPICGLAGEVARSGNVEMIADSHNDPRIVSIPGLDSLGENDGQAMMCIPLKSKAGEITGVLDLYRDKRNKFTRHEFEISEPFAAHSAAAIENAKLREELKENFESVRKAYEDIKQVDQAKDSLVNTISHELRTPLTTILGYLEMASEGLYGEVPPKLKEKFSTMLGSINRINDLVSKMLEMSRLQDETLSLELESVNLATVAKEVVKDYEEEAAARSHNVNVLFGNELPVVRADRLRMRDVLAALVDNAIRYTKDGGTITIGADILAGKVHIWVRDTGVGIADGSKGKVFDKFFLADAGLTREDGRVGIGLFISREIIRKHGGEMWFDSRKDVGSTFHFTVPIGSVAPR